MTSTGVPLMTITNSSSPTLLPADNSGDSSSCMPRPHSCQVSTNLSSRHASAIRESSGGAQLLPRDDQQQATFAVAASRQRQQRGKHGRNLRSNQRYQQQLQSDDEDQLPHGGGGHKAPNADAEAAASSSLLSAQEAAAAANRVASGAGEAASSSSTGNKGSCRGPWHDRRPPMDKGFKRLLRRLLAGFMADNRQRELDFPATLSAADR